MSLSKSFSDPAFYIVPVWFVIWFVSWILLYRYSLKHGKDYFMKKCTRHVWFPHTPPILICSRCGITKKVVLK